MPNGIFSKNKAIFRAEPSTDNANGARGAMSVNIE